jgi:lipid II:glycine glycyltransferase (peptidoglycan interpeptide bridge formation enzyme)
MSAEQQLRQEIAALQHELRRVNDALERSPSHSLEQRAKQLGDSIELCQRELKQLTASAAARASDE